MDLSISKWLRAKLCFWNATAAGRSWHLPDVVTVALRVRVPLPSLSSFTVSSIPSFRLDTKDSNTGIGRAGYDLDHSGFIFLGGGLKISVLFHHFVICAGIHFAKSEDFSACTEQPDREADNPLHLVLRFEMRDLSHFVHALYCDV
jgi:hypothetical protein